MATADTPRPRMGPADCAMQRRSAQLHLAVVLARPTNLWRNLKIWDPFFKNCRERATQRSQTKSGQ